jgi:hypothetical protein
LKRTAARGHGTTGSSSKSLEWSPAVWCRPSLPGGWRVTLARGIGVSPSARVVAAVGGGAAMGAGAVLARGCTSGQALTGGAMLSVGSWIFIAAAFGSAYAFARPLRALWSDDRVGGTAK